MRMRLLGLSYTKSTKKKKLNFEQLLQENLKNSKAYTELRNVIEKQFFLAT